MPKGAAPSQDQLLELLKRAADELKHAKEEARTAIIALQKEQAAHQKTEQGLAAALEQAKRAGGPDVELLKDQVDAERENGKVLSERVRRLEAALEGAGAERKTLESKLAEAETALSIAAQQAEATVQQLRRAHDAQLADLKAEHAAAVEENGKALGALKETHAAALEDHRQEQQAARAELRAQLDDAAQKLTQVQEQLAQEQAKHQSTAQKLLEARSKAQKLEAALADEQSRFKSLEATSTQMAEAHQTAQRELAAVTDRWHEVERQYEALHREMLLTLEQRDEARRMLENERAERERLTKALQQR